jgi:hypothetical protein
VFDRDNRGYTLAMHSYTPAVSGMQAYNSWREMVSVLAVLKHTGLRMLGVLDVGAGKEPPAYNWVDNCLLDPIQSTGHKNAPTF